MTKMEKNTRCPLAKSCGGCQYTGTPYEKQLKEKQKYLEGLFGSFGKVLPVIGMKNPFYYRNKVHHAFKRDRAGNIISGPYEKGSHWVLPSENCLIEDRESQEIIHGVRELLTEFHIRPYDEDTGHGILRHVLVRRGFASGEIMVVLVIGSKSLPSSADLVKALVRKYPKITTVVLNYNDKKTSMILGDRERILYGPGYIKDQLCGKTFRVSSQSFYQVNPVQTEILYRTALDFAELTGTETVIDAYCGIGTISLAASDRAGKVIGVELNGAAIRDAKINAGENCITNAEFHKADAGRFLHSMSERGERADVIFLDPPRSGSSREFMDAMIRMKPKRVVYISCGPESLARDLRYLTGNGFTASKIQPVDMFPFTEHVETCVLLSGEKVDEQLQIVVPFKLIRNRKPL